MAANEEGVCTVLFGDSAEEATAELRQRLPSVELREDASGLNGLLEDVRTAVDEPHLANQVPVAPNGTEFQLRVWQELRAIPAGETIDYSELAARVGKPTAVRAVARACATNPVAVLIPCHRVTRKDGSLAGYRWGVERKRALLALEAHNKQESLKLT